jgi:DNA-binding XRE family transcriptional regulator
MAIKSARLNVNRFWPDDLTITKAAEELDMNPRSLTTIRKGTERGEWLTLLKLAEYLSEKSGKQISLEDLFEVERD